MLSEAQRTLLRTAAVTPDPTRRRQAVALALHQHGPEAQEARALLSRSFLDVIQPSFHLIPREQATASESDFTAAYQALADGTGDFARTDQATLEEVLHAAPAALSALRMIISLTVNELAATTRLVAPDTRVSPAAIKGFERGESVEHPNARRQVLVRTVVATIRALMDRLILTVPEEAALSFHSKLDYADARAGWASVHHAAEHGVPYSGLLYQRYVGRAWRQVQDAYSEVKGDTVLELPLQRLLTEERIPHYRSPAGASGAKATAARYGLNPGPDFVIPDDDPAIIIESKVAEDGGTARDKASRIKNLADAGRRAGLVVCALIDGKGWTERPTALVEVVVATEGPDLLPGHHDPDPQRPRGRRSERHCPGVRG